MKKHWMLVCLSSVALLAACGNNADEGSSADANSSNSNTNTSENKGDGELSGDLTVLTNRTDIVGTTFERYAEEFNEMHPNVSISFEAITDYEGQVSTRMNTSDYGDVLLIPDSVLVEDAPFFFESLGTTAEIGERFLFAEDFAYEGETYGIPIVVNADGVLYNSAVFEEAGVTDIPSSPEEFLNALQMIRDNTDATPLYTNYGDGWPLDQWEPNRLSIAGDGEFVNDLPHEESPFAPGQPHYELYNVMYEAAARGLIEGDPLTTDWESSKQMLADGDVGAMVLGSWSYAQVEELAANPEDIAFMPFPYTQEDGTVYASVTPDYFIGVNANTDNSEAAHAWLRFFVEESGYWEEQGGISPIEGEEYPEFLQSFEELGAEFISSNPAREGEEGLTDRVDSAGEVGLWQPRFKQELIEAGIGNRDQSFDEIMEELNRRWQDGRSLEGVE